MSAAVTSEQIRRAAESIRNGGLVAFPTETVYGLGANALDAAAVERIFRVKGRPATSPLIVHVASTAMARELAAEWPAEAEALTTRFWPGPLTLVLGKAAHVPDVVTAGLPTVGLRMPAHPVALELIRQAGVPVAAPSANRFMGLSPTSAAHVRRALGNAVDMVLDAGPAEVGIESTVLSLVRGRAVLLRPGMVCRASIEAITGALESPGEIAGAHPSPGMHRRHYSPSTRLLMVSPEEPLPPGPGAVLRLTLARGDVPDVREVPMPAAPQAYAALLYAVLHDLDEQGLDWIAVERPPETAGWAAVLDRLRRAAG